MSESHRIVPMGYYRELSKGITSLIKLIGVGYLNWVVSLRDLGPGSLGFKCVYSICIIMSVNQSMGVNLGNPCRSLVIGHLPKLSSKILLDATLKLGR